MFMTENEGRERNKNSNGQDYPHSPHFCHHSAKAGISPVMGGVYLIAGTFLVTATYGLTNKLWAPRLDINSTTEANNVLDVAGESLVQVAVSEVTGTVGVTSNKATAAEAKSEVDQIIAGITAELRAIGLKNENIQTANYSINPNFDWSSGREVQTGFRVDTQVSIKTADVEMMNAAIDAAVELGATRVGQIGFQIGKEDREAAEREGIQLAFDKAEQRAGELAKMAGLELGKVSNVYSFCSSNSVMPMRAMNSAIAMEDQGSGGTALEVGSEEVNCSVSVTYRVK